MQSQVTVARVSGNHFLGAFFGVQRNDTMLVRSLCSLNMYLFVAFVFSWQK